VKLALSIAEAAKATSLSRSTINRMIRAGKLASTKIGGRRVIPNEAICAILTQHGAT